jgi:hypothetical protein
MKAIIFKSHLLFLGLLFSFGCASITTVNVKSTFPSTKINIDGQTDDWKGNLIPIKDTGVALGVANDKQYLYLCLRVDNQAYASQIMRAGMTIWFDSSGQKKKTLGLKYPLPFQPQKYNTNEESDQNSEQFPIQRSGAQSGSIYDPERLSELEIIRAEEKEPTRIKIAELQGLQVKLVPNRLGLIYELMLPIEDEKNCPLTINLSGSKSIALGFEINQFKPAFNQGRTGWSGRGGFPGGRGGIPSMGGGFGHGGVGRGYGRPALEEEPLRFWAVVSLSEAKEEKTATISNFFFY